MNDITIRFSSHRRGFAAIMAISLIILVGAALAMLGVYFAQDAARTRSEAVEAQLRQLLSAGAVAAVDHADTVGPARPLALPAALADEHAAVTIQITGEGEDRSVVVTAQFEGRHVDQMLKLHHANGRWAVVEADLNPPSQPPAESSASTQPSDRSTAASQRS